MILQAIPNPRHFCSYIRILLLKLNSTTHTALIGNQNQRGFFHAKKQEEILCQENTNGNPCHNFTRRQPLSRGASGNVSAVLLPGLGLFA
jgi:hypothetical protein